MAFDKTPAAKPALMTAAAALALYDAARPRTFEEACDLADTLAAALRAAPKARPAKAKPTGFRVDLTNAMALICKVAPNRHTIPVMNNVLLEARGDTLMLAATDLDQEVRIEIAAPGIGHWSTTANAKRLATVVKKGAGDVLLAPQGDKLEVMVGDALSVLPAIKADDFPVLSTNPTAHVFTMKAPDLARMLKFVRPAVSTEATRYYLNGAYFHTVSEGGVNKLRLVATDGHRLHLDDMDAPEAALGFAGVIIPRCALDTLAPLLAGQDDVRVEVATDKVRFICGGMTLLSQVVDGAFPDYHRVVPRQNGITYDLDTEVFAKSVERISAVSNERSRAITLDFGPDRLTLSCKNMDGDRAEETVPAERRPDCDETITIGFNATYLAEACKALASERMQFQMSDASSPVVAISRDQPQRICVLMPLRV